MKIEWHEILCTREIKSIYLLSQWKCFDCITCPLTNHIPLVTTLNIKSNNINSECYILHCIITLFRFYVFLFITLLFPSQNFIDVFMSFLVPVYHFVLLTFIYIFRYIYIYIYIITMGFVYQNPSFTIPFSLFYIYRIYTYHDINPKMPQFLGYGVS